MSDETNQRLDKIENMIEDLRVRDRLGRFDSLVLFIASSFGLTYMLLQYFFVGIKLFQYYVPFIFLGTFMPIYIGYWRGSITIDSLCERMRGLVYLFVGLFLYIFNILYCQFFDVQSVASVTMFMIVIPLSLISILFVFCIHFGILRILTFTLSLNYSKCFRNIFYTNLAAIALSLAFTVYAYFGWGQFYNEINNNTIHIIAYSSLGICFEIHARKSNPTIGYAIKNLIRALKRLFIFLLPWVVAFNVLNYFYNLNPIINNIVAIPVAAFICIWMIRDFRS